jgi:hypothetical protein
MVRIKLKWLYLRSTLAKNLLILPYFYVPHCIARELSLKFKKMYSFRTKDRYSLITMVFVIIILTEY